MTTFGATGRGSVFWKVLFCVAVLAAGVIAGRLAIEHPSRETISAARRYLSETEKEAILSSIQQQLKDVALANVTWPPLILLSRAGITDYCGVMTVLERRFEFYAQLVFPRADPRGKLSRVAFAVIAMPGDPQARYVVSTACLRYGYGSIETTP